MADIPIKKQTAPARDSGVQKLVYGISHDMGAPLRAVVQLSQMLKNRLGDRLDEKESYWLQLIEESGLHAQKMIEALLIYSRLTTHRQQDSQFDMRQILEQAIAELNAQEQQASAIVNIEGDWSECTGSEEQILQLLSCLIKNALLYQPKDSGHIAKVVISSEQMDGNIRIRVEDNGIGVQEKLWSVLTTPFKRMQSDKDYPGIGMGLTYCEKIAELHGGSLHIEKSTLGGFAVVYSWPVKEESL